MRAPFALSQHAQAPPRGPKTFCRPNTDRKEGRAPISGHAGKDHSGGTMRTNTIVLVALLLASAFARSSFASETTIDYSVEASASVQAYPPRITLHWPQDSCSTPQSYT